MQDVSVVIPAKNAEATIERAIRSVLAEDGILEVIVVNDGSTDRTADAVSDVGDPRVVLLHGSGLGIPKALNMGLDVAKGAFVGRCDADDWWTGDRLTWQREFLLRNPDYVAVSGGYATVTERGEHIADLAVSAPAHEVTEDLRRGQPNTHFCAWLTRTEAVRRMGGAREWFMSAQDLDMQFRLAALGRVWHAPHICMVYVLHGGSLTHTIASARRLFFQTSATNFARQRLDAGEDDLMRGCPPVFDEARDAADLRPSSADAHVAGQLTGEAWRLFGDGETRLAIRKLVLALRYDPYDFQRWRSFLTMLLRAAFNRGQTNSGQP